MRASWAGLGVVLIVGCGATDVGGTLAPTRPAGEAMSSSRAATTARSPAAVEASSSSVPAFNSDACARVMSCCPHFLQAIGEGRNAPRACPLVAYFLRQFPDEAERCGERLAEMQQTMARAGQSTPAACLQP